MFQSATLLEYNLGITSQAQGPVESGFIVFQPFLR
jgi:hypothetical protein